MEIICQVVEHQKKIMDVLKDASSANKNAIGLHTDKDQST